MNVLQLLDEVRRQVPLDAPFGTRWKATASVVTAHGVLEAAAAARIDAKGQRREQFWCDGVRVEQSVLLRLTCAEAECPQARQVRAQWQAFHQRGAAPARSQALGQGGWAPRANPQALPLMVELDVSVGGQRFSARPASFPCFTPCPNGAHPPMTIDKIGFDLFDDSGCLGGGVVETNGVLRPRIPTARAAEAFVLSRRLETLAAMSAASEASRRADGQAPEGH